MPGGRAAEQRSEQVEPGREAFAQLYRDEARRVYAYVRYRVSSEEEAEDVTAEVFEAALRAFPRYRVELGSAETWLFAIARKRLARHFRTMRLRRFLRLESVAELAGDRAEGPEEVARDRETITEMRRLVAELGGREKEILALKFGGGLTNRQIALLTGISESNVGTLIYRVLHRLRRGLEK